MMETFKMNDINRVPQNGKFQQFLTAIIVNLVSLSSGITWGWPSPILPQLRKINPPVGDTPMSEEQISWISSLMAIGGLLTIPFCGILAERYGRKNFAWMSGLPHIISWILIIFGQNSICLYLARLAGGMGAAMMLFIVPLYLSEIASKEIRGKLGSLLPLCDNMGILFAYVAGAFLSYRLFASLSIIVSLVFVVAFAFMPETPVYLVSKNRPLQAHKSLMFFRGNNRDLVQEELSRLQSHASTPDSSSKKTSLSYMYRDRATRKGLMISFMLIAGQQLSGILAMISYAETIFKRAGSSVSSETAPIIIGVIQIFGSSMSTMLIERAGRRKLALMSCFGMTISHSTVGLFFFLQQNNYNLSSISWLPLVALSIYIVTYCLGMESVPFVVPSEVFRQDVSSFAITVCYIFYWAISFASIKAFGPAMQTLGIGGCFFMLAIFCAACFVSCYCFLPETKGRKREDIVDELAGISRSYRESNCASDKHAGNKDPTSVQSVS